MLLPPAASWFRFLGEFVYLSIPERLAVCSVRSLQESDGAAHVRGLHGCWGAVG